MTDLKTSLKGTSFTFGTRERRPRLILTVDGEDKTGKTHFGYTAPGPIASQSIDFGDEGVVQKFQEAGKEIAVAEYSRLMPDSMDRKDLGALQKWYREQVVLPFVRDFKAALKAGVRSLVLDTATEFWEVMRLSHFGKADKVMPQMYTAVNAEWQELIRLANDNDTNLILLHQVKDEWENYTDSGGQNKSRTTGRKVRAGNEKIGYLVQAQLVTRYVPAVKDRKGGVKEEARFELEIVKCRHNPEVVGMVLTNEMANFQTVAGLIVPEVDPAVWE